MSQFIPEDERLVTIEDSAELKLSHWNLVRLEGRPANIEGKGRISIRDLVINALRMRPDRIIVGECRGAEALDMLQAMNTGHDGSMSTIHANSPLDALYRLETCSLFSGLDIPISALRSQIASAVNGVVHTARLPDGSRKIVAVSEVLPLQNGEYRVQTLMQWKTHAMEADGRISGNFEKTSAIPSFKDEAEISALPLE